MLIINLNNLYKSDIVAVKSKKNNKKPKIYYEQTPVWYSAMPIVSTK